MAARLEFKIEGLRELRQALKDLGPELSEVILSGALRRSGEVLAHAMADRAPIAPEVHRRGKPVGELKRSIRVEVAWKSPVDARVTVGPRVPYAYPVEYGHAIIARGPSRKGLSTDSPRGKKGRFVKVGGRRGELRSALKARQSAGPIGHVAARPFVRPAFDATQREMIDIFANTLTRTVEESRALRRLGARRR